MGSGLNGRCAIGTNPLGNVNEFDVGALQGLNVLAADHHLEVRNPHSANGNLEQHHDGLFVLLFVSKLDHMCRHCTSLAGFLLRGPVPPGLPTFGTLLFNYLIRATFPTQEIKTKPNGAGCNSQK